MPVKRLTKTAVKAQMKKILSAVYRLSADRMLQGSDSKVNMSSPKLMDIHKAVDLARRKLK